LNGVRRWLRGWVGRGRLRGSEALCCSGACVRGVLVRRLGRAGLGWRVVVAARPFGGVGRVGTGARRCSADAGVFGVSAGRCGGGGRAVDSIFGAPACVGGARGRCPRRFAIPARRMALRLTPGRAGRRPACRGAADLSGAVGCLSARRGAAAWTRRPGARMARRGCGGGARRGKRAACRPVRQARPKRDTWCVRGRRTE
jgi:hypothetical protein